MTSSMPLSASSAPSSSFPSTFAFAARKSLSPQELAASAPAVFAEEAAARTGPKYVFISTREIVRASTC